MLFPVFYVTLKLALLTWYSLLTDPAQGHTCAHVTEERSESYGYPKTLLSPNWVLVLPGGITVSALTMSTVAY